METNTVTEERTLVDVTKEPIVKPSRKPYRVGTHNNMVSIFDDKDRVFAIFCLPNTDRNFANAVMITKVLNG